MSKWSLTVYWLMSSSGKTECCPQPYLKVQLRNQRNSFGGTQRWWRGQIACLDKIILPLHRRTLHLVRFTHSTLIPSCILLGHAVSEVWGPILWRKAAAAFPGNAFVRIIRRHLYLPFPLSHSLGLWLRFQSPLPIGQASLWRAQYSQDIAVLLWQRKPVPCCLGLLPVPELNT